MNALDELYEILVKRPADKRFKMSADYLGIPGARMICPNEYEDPKAWYKGKMFYCEDVETYLLDMIEDMEGVDERDEAATDDETFMYYAEEYRDDLISFINEIGEPISWEDFYTKMVA